MDTKYDVFKSFLENDEDAIVKTTLKKGERELVNDYAENLIYIENQFLQMAEKGFTYGWDEEEQCWKTEDDGSFKKIYLNKEDKLKIIELGGQTIKILKAKINSIIKTSRNDPNNHFANTFAGEIRKEKEVEEDERGVLQRLKDKINGEEGSEEEE